MNKTSETIVFFGNEKLATGLPVARPLIKQAVEKAGFTIENVITGPLQELRKHRAKLAVLAAYGRIIPQSVLDQFPLGIINVHPSLLPAYRGPTPIEQAILDGTTRTGVSIMSLTSGMDEGPIYKQKIVHLNGSETKLEVAEQLQQLGANLIEELLPAIANNHLNPHKQPHPDRATYSHKISKADGLIDIKKSAVQLEREVRAFTGWPGSYTVLAGKDVIILEAHATQEVGSKELFIKTGEGFLVIDYLKPAGKPEMTAQAFLAGHKQLLT